MIFLEGGVGVGGWRGQGRAGQGWRVGIGSSKLILVDTFQSTLGLFRA